MTKILFILILIISISTAAKSQNQKAQLNSKLEDKVIDTIASLKEVKERTAYIKKETRGKRNLSFMIAGEPSKETPYYWVKVMEDNGGAYHTHFNFYVHSKTMKILYQDEVIEKKIDLKTWRSQKAN